MRTSWRFLAVTLSAWLGYVAVDFLLHAALLAFWWQATASFWLPPAVLFARIPVGYASFLVYCIALTWLLDRLDGERCRVNRWAGLGVIAGFVYGTASVLAMYSVIALPLSALLMWPCSAAVGSGVAGGAAAFVATAHRPWRRSGLVFVGAVVTILMGILLQNMLGVTAAGGVSHPPSGGAAMRRDASAWTTSLQGQHAITQVVCATDSVQSVAPAHGDVGREPTLINPGRRLSQGAMVCACVGVMVPVSAA